MKVSGVMAWHPNVAMTSEEIDDFLAGRWVARFATIGKDGYPHVTPLWFYWDGKCVYVELTRNRQSCKNLKNNPRCSVVIDMDDRPLMGIHRNMAKAALIIGDAELTEVGSGKKVVIEAGPWKGEYLPEEMVIMIIQRYCLSERDGALGTTLETFKEILSRQDIEDTQLFKDNVGRTIVKVVPKKIQAWDFSKGPIGYVQTKEGDSARVGS
jgi:uncharacterized pyridoxamine 5'-phosphate oxidase family protein